ncbi:MAG: aldehyde dehydrogenase family protein [Bacilli bacterium]|nr:aldehyde dehydrogenase family protein [Bacilli bacterium]
MKNLIGKDWCDSSNNKTIEVINPATSEFIDFVPDASIDDVKKAVEEANKALKDWGNTPLYQRAELLMKFNDLVKRDFDKLAELLSNETGKPIKEAINEINNIDIAIKAFCEKAKHEYGNVIESGQEKGNEKTIQMTISQPLGVVVAILPFNFPCDLFCQKVPSALLMGNSIIVKPSTYNPLTVTSLVELLIEAGIPYGVVQVISGGVEVAQSLASNKNVALVSLTGSTTAGKDVLKLSSENLTHTMLELGGNDAFILAEDGDVDLAVEETIWGRLYNTGQVCCASKRFLIHKNVKTEYIEKLISKIKTLKVGLPSNKDTDIGCLINENAAIRVEEQVKKTIDQGAKLVYGGRRNKAFFEPTILDNVTKDMDVAKDMEIFGPVISIIEFEDIAEAVEIANSSSFGLSGSIITSNMKTAFDVSKSLECGGVVINGASFFRSFEMPFGGWKHSGIGNEGVMSTLHEMSHTKTIILKNIEK